MLLHNIAKTLNISYPCGIKKNENVKHNSTYRFHKHLRSCDAIRFKHVSRLNADVHLLHVVKTEKEAALSKMNAQINSHSSKTGKTAKPLVVEGSVFEAIPAETERMRAHTIR